MHKDQAGTKRLANPRTMQRRALADSSGEGVRRHGEGEQESRSNIHGDVVVALVEAGYSPRTERDYYGRNEFVRFPRQSAGSLPPSRVQALRTRGVSAGNARQSSTTHTARKRRYACRSAQQVARFKPIQCGQRARVASLDQTLPRDAKTETPAAA